MRASTHRSKAFAAVIIVCVAGIFAPVSPVSALDAPTVTSIVGGPGENKMTLTWTAVTGATSYAYASSTDSGVTWSSTKIGLGATSPATVPVRTTCRYAAASHGSACRFRVYALDLTGGSAPSSPAGPVAWGTSVPTAPVNVRGKATTASYTTMTVSWAAPVNTGGLPVTSYRVQVSNDGGSWTETPWSPVAVRTYTETAGTCTGNATCRYRVYATTANGEGAVSTAGTVTVSPSAVRLLRFDNSAELNPDPSASSAGVASMRITWTVPATGLTVGYEWAIQEVTTDDTGAITYGAWSAATDLAMVANVSTTCPVNTTTCYLRVRGYSDRGEAAPAYGPWVTVNYQPWAPYSLGGDSTYDLTATRVYGATKTITISVSGPKEGGPGPKNATVKTYVVQACDVVTTSGCTLNSDWSTVSNGSLVYPTGLASKVIDVATPCADDGHACSLRVRLENVVAAASGAFKVGTYKGLWSRVETAYVTVPGAPTIGAASPGNTTATLTWTAPESDGGPPITGYTVTPYIGEVAQTPVVFNSTDTTQTLTGLTNGITYTFRVAATNAAGTGANSEASNTVTPG